MSWHCGSRHFTAPSKKKKKYETIGGIEARCMIALFPSLHSKDTSPHTYLTIHPRTPPPSNPADAKLIHNLFPTGPSPFLTFSITYFPHHPFITKLSSSSRLSDTPRIPSNTFRVFLPLVFSAIALFTPFLSFIAGS